MIFITIFNQVLVLFLLMGLGYRLAKKGKLDKSCSDQMTFLLCYIIMPCVILSAFQLKFDQQMFHNLIIVAVFTIIIHIVSIIAAHIIFNKKTVSDKNSRAMLRFASIYSNCGFMGFPLLITMLSTTGVFYGSAFNSIYGIFLWTHGLLLYTRRLDFHSLVRVLINPNIIVSVVGVLLYYFSIKLPTPIFLTAKFIAELNTALSMIIVGSTMTKIPFKSIFSSGKTWFCVILKNLIFPLLILCLLHFYNVNGNVLISIVILAACPTAGLSVLFAKLTVKDEAFPGKILALSTLCSLFTMPLVIVLSKYWS